MATTKLFGIPGLDKLLSNNPSVLDTVVQQAKNGSPNTVNSVITAANDIATDPTKLQDLITNGQNLINKGTGVVTQAQQDLKQLSTTPALLPKTLALKNAESLLGLPQIDGTQQGVSMTFPPEIKWVLIGVAVLIVAVVVYKMVKK